MALELRGRSVPTILAALAVTAAPGQARAASCIDEDVVIEMEQCASVAKPVKAVEKAPTIPNAVVAVKVIKEGEVEGVEWEDLESVSEEKKKKQKEIEKVKLEFLLKALEATKKLHESMGADDPKKPVALHQMAEKCFTIGQKYEFKARQLDETLFMAKKSGDEKLVEVVQLQQEKFEVKSGKYRSMAIAYYTELVLDHTGYDQRETVLFNLAWAFDEMSALHPVQKEEWARKAREVYKMLIKEFPGSGYVPHALLSFAEYYFMEGKPGSMGNALKFYKEVTKHKGTSVYAYALYRQAWCLYNMQDYSGTLGKFIEVIEFSNQNPEDENAKQLQEKVRMELHMPFSKVKPPDHAWEFFSKYGGGLAVQGMENLADSYFNQGFWRDAIVVYHKLMAVRPGSDSLCSWQHMVVFAVSSVGSKEEQLVELGRLASVYEKYVAEDHPAEARDQCLADAREVIANKAFAWHREAVGTDTQPGTGDVGTMKKAIAAYEVLMDLYTASGKAWDEVPQAGPADTWVTPYEVAYYRAELMWSMDDWARCGPAFDEVVDLDPEGPYAMDSLQASALCYTHLYNAHHKKGVKPSTSGLAAKMLGSFKRYVCHAPGGDDLESIMYQMARVYYEAGHYHEAAYWFGRIAYDHVGSDVGPFAANLYLDALHGIMLQDESRGTACLDRIASSAHDFITQERFGAYLEDPLFRQVVHQVKCDSERKKAETLQAASKFKQAALVYKDLYEKWGGECDERLDEVLWNMGVTFQAANLLGQAIKWRKVLMEKFPESEHARRAIYEVGANYHAIAMYAQAAEFYEEYARRFPGEDDAHVALENAITFRLGLGEYEKALDDASLFIKSYSSGKKKKPIEVARVAFAIGQIHARQEKWSEVISHYSKFVKKHKTKGVIDLRLRALVEIAGAWREKNQEEKAWKAYGSAAKLFKEETLGWIQGAGASEAEREADRAGRGGLMLDAVSEAFFNLGERAFEKFDAVTFPDFDPKKIKNITYDDDPVKAADQKALYHNPWLHSSTQAWKDFRNLMKFYTWTKKDLAAWALKKTTTQAEAIEFYGKAVDLGVPEWVIASAARVGDMNRQFFDAYYDAPIPDAIRKDTNLLEEYLAERDRQALVFKGRAIEGFQICLLEATRSQWYNEWSSLCEKSLTELDAGQFPISSEMKGKGSYAKEFVAVPGIEIDLGGSS